MLNTFIVAFSIPVFADEISNLNEYIDDEILNALPDGIKEVVEANDTYSGPSVQGTLNYIVSLLKTLIDPVLDTFFMIIGVVILCSCFYMLAGIGGDSASVRIYRFLASISLAVMVFGILKNIWLDLDQLLMRLNTLMNSITVATTSIYALSGSVTAAVINESQMMLILTLIEDLIYYSTYPVLQICFGMSFVSCIGESVDLSSLASLIRKTFTTVLIILMSIVTTVLSFQNTLAQSNDSFMIRTVKIASGSFIPLVGNALSEATRTIAAGIDSLKSTLGIISIIALISTVLPLFITIWLNRFSFSIASAFCEVLGLDREAGFLKGSAEILDFSIAIISAITMIFVINLIIFVKSKVIYGV
ncbi:MAG: hypothetical protein IJC50_07635 [Clostridia bacterium]|nr:hypothetical protein [Clostridia bacterium]